MRFFRRVLLSVSLLTLCLCALESWDVVAQQHQRRSASSYADQWLVILSSSKQQGVVPAGLLLLQQNPSLGARVARLSSSEFKGLMPCYEVVVAQAFSSKKKAVQFAKKLQRLKIDHYLKNAGKYVGIQRHVEAHCRGEAQPTSFQCGAMRWVEEHKGTLFLHLPLADALAQRVQPISVRPKQWKGSLTTWIAPTASRRVGGYEIGKKYNIFSLKQNNSVATCAIKRFVFLTRGQPHFGWMQTHSQGRKPKAPGCGEPVLFAQLSCAPQTLPRGLRFDFALPVEHKTPAMYLEQPTTPQPQQLAQLQELFLKDDGYHKTLAKATQDAEKKKETLRRHFSFRSFAGLGRTLFLFQVRLQTKEGNVFCGAEDVRMDLYGVAEKSASGQLKQLQPLVGLEADQKVEGLFDLESDGRFEVLLSSFYSKRSIIRSVTGQSACSITVSFCDCSC